MSIFSMRKYFLILFISTLAKCSDDSENAVALKKEALKFANYGLYKTYQIVRKMNELYKYIIEAEMKAIMQIYKEEELINRLSREHRSYYYTPLLTQHNCEEFVANISHQTSEASTSAEFGETFNIYHISMDENKSSAIVILKKTSGKYQIFTHSRDIKIGENTRTCVNKFKGLVGELSEMGDMFQDYPVHAGNVLFVATVLTEKLTDALDSPTAIRALISQWINIKRGIPESYIGDYNTNMVMRWAPTAVVTELVTLVPSIKRKVVTVRLPDNDTKFPGNNVGICYSRKSNHVVCYGEFLENGLQSSFPRYLGRITTNLSPSFIINDFTFDEPVQTDIAVSYLVTTKIIPDSNGGEEFNNIHFNETDIFKSIILEYESTILEYAPIIDTVFIRNIDEIRGKLSRRPLLAVCIYDNKYIALKITPGADDAVVKRISGSDRKVAVRNSDVPSTSGTKEIKIENPSEVTRGDNQDPMPSEIESSKFKVEYYCPSLQEPKLEEFLDKIKTTVRCTSVTEAPFVTPLYPDRSVPHILLFLLNEYHVLKNHDKWLKI